MKRAACLWALAAVHPLAASQSFVYVEPGIAACPAAPAPTAAKTVTRGVPVSGSLRVTCGFDQGSYTVTLNASDPGATIAPKSFLVNFGRLVGTGAFTVTFPNVGPASVSTAITSNMGSPAVRGQFLAPSSEFNVAPP